MRSKQMFFKSWCKKFSNMALEYPSKEKSMEEIRNHLIKFTGGSVDLFKRDDGLAVVALNHEEKKNAISGKMMVDLQNVVEDLSSWSEGRGVILKGNGGNFCSGGDLDFVKKTSNPEDGFDMSTLMQNVLNKFQRLPMVTVALVEGIGALGGGAELTLACDFILISETCKGIGFVHGKMGIVPAWGGTNRIIEKIGYAKALNVLLGAKLLSPNESIKIGLADDVIPTVENNEQYALEWLRNKTRFGTNVTRCIKVSLSTARDYPRDYEKERRLFAPFWGGPAHQEALMKNIKHKPES